MLETPWSDCKVAFSINSPDKIWKYFERKPANMGRGLPKGWQLSETDTSGARAVAVFRINGVPTATDGSAVLALLDRIDDKD